ncbi:MAG: hypothetical protein ACREEL_03605 [Stellaceae bacterium]
MFKRIWLKSTLMAGALALGGGIAVAPTPAAARVFVHVGVPFCCGPYYYYPPPPVVYYPPPVYNAPPPVVYTPPPTPVAPQAQTWYYCDNPKGYYPYVSNCTSGWRQVPARP